MLSRRYDVRSSVELLSTTSPSGFSGGGHENAEKDSSHVQEDVATVCRESKYENTAGGIIIIKYPQIKGMLQKPTGWKANTGHC
jgi:hypothetical protein